MTSDRRQVTMVRTYRSYTYKDSNFRICCRAMAVPTTEIRRQRLALEAYIVRHPEFLTSMVPVPLQSGAPDIAQRMACAAAATGVGPMAAVAGTIAQLAAEALVRCGESDVIVENGGDMYIVSEQPVTVGLYAGAGRIADALAFSLSPSRLPLAVCSSSSRMGHSTSLGDCDLATVVSADAALADAAATLAGNLVRTVNDIDSALERIAGISGVQGILIVKDDRVGLAGNLPELVRSRDRRLRDKVTRDRLSSERPGSAL